MSTFINSKEDILAWVGSKFIIFTKLGNLIQTVDIKLRGKEKYLNPDDLELINISDN